MAEVVFEDAELEAEYTEVSAGFEGEASAFAEEEASIDLAELEGGAQAGWAGMLRDMADEELVQGITKGGLEDVEAGSALSEAMPSQVEMKDAGVNLLEKYKWIQEGDVTAEVGQASGELVGTQFQSEGAQMARSAEGDAGAAEDAEVKKSSRLKTAGKIATYTFGGIMALDWIANKLGAIISVNMDVDPPEWAQSMTDEQKADIQAVSDALPQLSVLIDGWQQQWKALESVELGEVDVTFNSTTQSVPVIYILYYALTDMQSVVANTQSIFSGDTDSLSTADMIMAINNIFIILADCLSIYDLKDISVHLQLQDFPPTKDKETITKIVLTFKNGPDKVAAVGVKYTRFAIQNTVSAFMQVKLIQEIYSEIQNVVLPAMQTAAKDAYTKAAKLHMQLVKPQILLISLEPGVGIENAKEKIAEEQKKASELGTAAANKAAEDKMTELQPQVAVKAQEIVKAYAEENQDQLKKVAEMAMQDAMGQMSATLDGIQSDSN